MPTGWRATSWSTTPTGSARRRPPRQAATTSAPSWCARSPTAPGSWSSRAPSRTAPWSTGSLRSSTRSSPTRPPPAGRPATTSPLPGPTAGSGTRSRSWRYRAPEVVRRVLRQRCARPRSRRPGSGPAYQVTSQVNVVRPGGQAQEPHRDYHLGFITDEVIARYPTHAHALSPVLTLQGAVAHSDMPLESGPTIYLPYSHQYLPGYLAWRTRRLQGVLRRAHDPAAAPQGRRGVLQPGAVPRRRHERLRRTSSGWPTCSRSPRGSAARWSRWTGPGWCRPSTRPSSRRSRPGRDAARRGGHASAEGYPFPTNLDHDPPVDGLTPVTQAQLVHRALDEGWEPVTLTAALRDYTARRRT